MTYSQWALQQAADLASIYSEAWTEVEPEFSDLEAREERGQDVAQLFLWRLPQLSQALEAAATNAHASALATLEVTTQEAVARASKELDQQGAELAGLLAGFMEAARQDLKATIAAYLAKYQRELTTTLNRVLRTGQLEGKSITSIMADLEKSFGVFAAPETARDMLKGLSGASAKVARAVFNELAEARSTLYQSAFSSGTYSGVHFTAGPGPCPSRVCPTRAGTYYGADAVAELRNWPRHPWCKCTVRFLTSTQEED